MNTGQVTGETYAIWICEDCLMLLANGETNPEWTEEQEAEFIAAIDEKWPADWVLAPGCSHDSHNWSDAETVTDEDRDACDEGGFSWTQCDGCGSTLGGSRYPAGAFKVSR